MSQGSFSIDVNPAVLEWARKAAGQTTAYVAERVGVSEQTVNQWETGTKPPTWKALRKLATFYQRPLAALLLPEPPQEPDVPPDFRTLPANRKKLSPSTLLAIRTAHWLQSRAIEMRRELNVESPFSLKRIRLTQRPEALADEARKLLGIELDEQFAWETSYKAYSRWRESIEEQGVLVFQFPFPLKEVRGFSLFDTICPIIVVNEADDPIARVFTLLHEYAHLLLQKPGICLPQEVPISSDGNVEPFCNRFAAAVLLPASEINQWQIPSSHHGTAVETQLRQLARKYSVSKYVVLFRLAGVNRLSASTARSIEKLWTARDASRPATKQKTHTGGASAVKICRRRRGKAFIDLVQQAEKRGVITTHDMVTYLGVNLNDLKKLEST